MSLFTELDIRTLQKYYDTGNLEAAEELLTSYYHGGNKDFVNQAITRIFARNVNSVTVQPKYENYDLSKPFLVRWSKLLWKLILVGCLIFSGVFAYVYMDNDQQSTAHIIMSGCGLAVAIYSVYYLRDNHPKYIMNVEAIQKDYEGKEVLKWKDILTAFQYIDPSVDPTVYRLIIYKKTTIEPVHWNIAFLNRTADEIAFVFNQFLRNANEN